MGVSRSKVMYLFMVALPEDGKGRQKVCCSPPRASQRRTETVEAGRKAKAVSCQYATYTAVRGRDQHSSSCLYLTPPNRKQSRYEGRPATRKLANCPSDSDNPASSGICSERNWAQSIRTLPHSIYHFLF